MAERILAAIAAEQVPALAGERDDHRRHEGSWRYVLERRQRAAPRASSTATTTDRREAPSRRRPEQAGRAEQQHEDEDHEDAELAEAVAEDKGRDRLSTTPTKRPPISAPGTDPMPPSTTMVKAISTIGLADARD